MFGMNTKGKTFCIFAKNFKPFFYVLGEDDWIKGQHDWQLKMALINKLSDDNTGLENDICSCTLVQKKKLYGFDNFKKYNFVKIEFKNISAFNKVKNYWYTENKDFTKRKLKPDGYEWIIYGNKLKTKIKKMDALLNNNIFKLSLKVT